MKLSIITVNLNNLKGLKKTYESVVCQTFTDYEWLIIDGGSTDGSREFIEEHQDKFSYWCSEPDNGIYNAMNKGIIHAKGEYLNFMNSGDYFAHNEVLAELFSQQCSADILYGILLYSRKNKIFPINIHNKLHWYDLYLDSLPHQATFIKCNLFKMYGLYDENYKCVSDWKWFIQTVLYQGATCEFYPIEIALFEGDGISSTRQHDIEVENLRKELIPKIMTEEDYAVLLKLSVIQSHKLSRLLYELIGVITWRLDSFVKKYVVLHK